MWKNNQKLTKISDIGLSDDELEYNSPGDKSNLFV